MDTSQFAYTGCDNLEVMTEAVQYNRFLVGTVEKQIDSPDPRVLDFGAGSGTYADLLTREGIVADCLEPDERLREQLLAKGYKVVDSVGDLPEAERYDIVYSFNVLEHIKNDQEAVENIAALLRPGGKLIIYVPALESLFSSMDTKVGHYRRYRRAQLDRILRNAGLRIEQSRYCDPLGFFATLAYKLLGNADGAIDLRALRLYDRWIFPVSRALQPITGKTFGKNVMVVAVRP